MYGFTVCREFVVKLRLSADVGIVVMVNSNKLPYLSRGVEMSLPLCMEHLVVNIVISINRCNMAR